MDLHLTLVVFTGLEPVTLCGERPRLCSVSFPFQAVMACVVWRDPRLVVPHCARYHVTLPSCVFRDPSPLDFVLYPSLDDWCMPPHPRQSTRSVVSCGCGTHSAPVWHLVTVGVGWVCVADHNYAILQLDGLWSRSVLSCVCGASCSASPLPLSRRLKRLGGLPCCHLTCMGSGLW